MTTLKEQIEQWIEREASNRFKSHQLMTAHLYKAGAHSILPMLLVAVEALDATWPNMFDEIRQHHKEALNKIKQIIEVK